MSIRNLVESLVITLAALVVSLAVFGVFVYFYAGVKPGDLYYYIYFAAFNYLVEGPLRDPTSLNKPSTYPIDVVYQLGKLPGFDVHWGLAYGVVFCILAYLLMDHTTFGFAARMAGGNIRAAQASGLP